MGYYTQMHDYYSFIENLYRIANLSLYIIIVPKQIPSEKRFLFNKSNISQYIWKMAINKSVNINFFLSQFFSTERFSEN